jgi:hypothetical protein
MVGIRPAGDTSSKGRSIDPVEAREPMLGKRASRRRAGEPLPMLVNLGLTLLIVGLAVDIGSHVLAGGAGVSAALGHMLTLAGMVLALIGVLQVAFRSKPHQQKGGGDDVRSDLTVG